MPDLPSGGDNCQFGGGTRHDSASNQHDSNPAIATPHLLWLSIVHTRLTPPEKAYPCLRIEKHKKNTVDATQISNKDEAHKVGVPQIDTRRNSSVKQ